MGSRLGGDSDDVIADINITPFVDIILVVLIIFMVTAQTIMKQAIQVQLPEAASGATTEDVSLGITLLADGSLLLDGEASTGEGVRQAILGVKAQGRDAVVLISADKEVAHGRVVWILDVIQKAGVAKFAINIDPAQVVPPDPGQGR